MKPRFIPLLALLAPALVLANDCDLPKGARSFANKCAICHAAEAGATHTVGPNLHGVVGRPVGQAPGFTYSAALGGAGGGWDEARLDAFLAAPDKAIPGTAMPFQGLKSASERRHLICFLNTLK
jgi:cytochrome c